MAKIEDFVVDKIKTRILTDDNLEELVKLTNDEVIRSFKSSGEKLELLAIQIQEIDTRLERLYDALETSKLNLDEVTQRVAPSSPA